MDFLEPHSYFCICLYLFKKAEALRHLLDLHNIPVTNEREMIAQLVKNLLAMQETWVLIPGLGRSSGERNGNPLQYSCLENPMGGGASWAIVHGVTKSRT